MNKEVKGAMKSRFWAVFIVLLMTLGICVQSWAATEITWLCRSNPKEQVWQKALIEAFEKAYPDIKVKQVIVPWDQYDQKMSTMFAAGTPPDIFSNWAWNGFMDMTLRGMTLDVTPLIKRDKIDFTPYFPYPVNYYKVAGRYYGLPIFFAPSGIWYNKDLFDKAGVSYPSVNANDKSWNWNALLEKAQKLTKDINGDGKIDQYGVNATVDLWGGFPSIVWLFGGDIFPREAYTTGIATKCNVNNPIAIEATQAVGDLIYKYHVAPTPAEGQALSALGDPFRTGRIAMNMTGGWGWWIFNDIKAFKVGAAVLPWGNPSRKRELVVGCDPYLIAKTSKNKEAAWTFVKFAMSPEGQKITLNTMTIPVPSKDLFTEWKKIWKDIPSKDLDSIFETSMTYGRPAADHRLYGYLEIGKLFNTELDPLFLGKSDAKTCLDSIQEKLTKLLNERIPLLKEQGLLKK